MKKVGRLAGLLLVAVVAVGLVGASAAFAAPEFNPGSGITLLGTSGTSILLTPGAAAEVECKKDNASGEIKSKTLAGNIVVHFLECEGKEGTNAKCPVMSPGAPKEDLIQTTTLHGVLGLILPIPASGSDVAIVLLPASGNKFVNLLGSAGCIATTQVTGTVAGKVEPIGVKSKTGKIVFAAPGGKQEIGDVDLSTGGLVKPELVAFGTTSTESTTEFLTFDGGELEVT